MQPRNEPDSAEQLQRRAAYEAAHPEVQIFRRGAAAWQAVITEENGQTILTRYTLRELLDRLESLAS